MGLPTAGNKGVVTGKHRIQTAAADAVEISQARGFVADQLTSWGCDHVGDVELVLSELVTNAVMHAGGAPAILVSRTDDGRHVRLEVHDDLPVSPVARDGSATGGFGLRIVDQLSEHWGTSPTPTGKVVWALIRT